MHNYGIQSKIVFDFNEVVRVQGDSRERAVAFHSITFIDSLAKPLGSIIFGNSSANDLQGTGWFENESSAEVGSIQWSGTPAKQSNIQLTIPPCTEGMLLKIKAIQDSLWMKVSIEEDSTAMLLVDTYWHSGYVPIGEAKIEDIPTTQPQWHEGRYFPHFPSTDYIYAIRTHHGLSQNPESIGYAGAWFSDWRINHSYESMMALTLVCMQGVINRNRPCVYLDWVDNSNGSAFWISEMEKHVEVNYLDLDGLSALNFLLRRYANRFAGAVVYDPNVPNTINVATMIAGLENRLVVAPEQLNLPGIRDLKSILDLRVTVQEQGWDDSEESQTKIHQWIYDSLWHQLDHRIIGLISPGPPNSGSIFESTNRSWPIKMAARDYLVALKLPALHLSPIDDDQSELFGKFLEDAPSPIPITGVYSSYEAETLTFVSRFGDWVSGITWPGTPVDSRGLSVLSGIRPEIVKLKPEIDKERILSTLGNSPVTMMWASDGDNMALATERGFYPFYLWEDTQNQRFNWTFNPTVAELSPVMWNYYMNVRKDVGMTAGFSGAGYTFPQEMSDNELKKYLEYSARYLEETGMRTIHIDDRSNQKPWSKHLATAYYDHLSHSGYLGSIYGSGTALWGLNLSYAGVPSPTVEPTFILATNNRSFIIDEILSRKPGEIFMDIAQHPQMINNPHIQIINDTAAAGDHAVIVKTESISNPGYIFNSDAIVLAPGNYTVAFRMKVSDNQSSDKIVSIFVGKRFAFPDWKVIATKNISPADFSESNQYQDFFFSFTLDTLTPFIQFRVDYGSGELEWTADYVRVQKEGEADLPVLATLFIVLTIDWAIEKDLNRTVERFTELFESQGGIVLNPDEYLAALNPEYMIELATPILGLGDSSLIRAKTQLGEKDFYGSLITVRNALKEIKTSALSGKPPRDLFLINNYPNPFKTTTTIQFSISKAQNIKMSVYNMLGQSVSTLINGEMLAGTHEVHFNGEKLVGGVYFLQIETKNSRAVRKMLYLPQGIE